MSTSRAQQQYSLRWNNYLKHITFAFEDLKLNGDLVDVTLCCDGQKIKAHKVLLSACSAYFKEIFKENPHPHPIIVFKFIKFEDLNSIIQFIYQGEVNVVQDQLQSFLQTAELLAIQGLTTEDKASNEKNPLIPEVSSNNVTKILPSTIQAISTTNVTNNTSGSSTAITKSAPTTSTTFTLDQNQVAAVTQQQQIPTSLGIKRRKSTAVTSQSKKPDVFTECITFSKDNNHHTTGIVLPAGIKVDPSEIMRIQDITPQIVNEQETQTIDKITIKSDNDQYTTEYQILEDPLDQIEDKNAIHMTIDTEDDGGMETYTTTTNSDSQHKTIYITTTSAAPNEVNTSGGGGTGDGTTSQNKWTECSYCKMTITTVNLWRHIRTQHTPEPPKVCELCSKHFKNKYSLREHIRITHEQKQAK